MRTSGPPPLSIHVTITTVPELMSVTDRDSAHRQLGRFRWCWSGQVVPQELAASQARHPQAPPRRGFRAAASD